LFDQNGEQVPADSTILWGEASVSEAIITGESSPVSKSAKERSLAEALFLMEP
jgi:Cu+-exporting ATPase